jgi:hypothetical protein
MGHNYRVDNTKNTVRKNGRKRILAKPKRRWKYDIAMDLK